MTDKRSEKQYQAHMTALALRISEQLDGVQLTEVATVAMGIAAHALIERFPDMDERAQIFAKLVKWMADLLDLNFEMVPMAEGSDELH